MKNKVAIELCGKEYILVTDEPEDYVKDLALQVNKMIDDAMYRNLRTSKNDAAILSCLDLCDKIQKLNNNNDSMRGQISVYIDEIATLNKKLAAFERQKGGKSSASKTISTSEDLL